MIAPTNDGQFGSSLLTRLNLILPPQYNNLLRAHPLLRHNNAFFLNQLVSIQLVQKSPGRPSLRVADLDASTAFYTAFFGTAPKEHTARYTTLSCPICG
jgi:hypothetical protein